MSKIKIHCPYCNGNNTKKGGYLKSGNRRYFCNDCKKSFSKNTQIKQPLNVTCPNCGSKSICKSGFNKLGSQRYVCKDCSKKFHLDGPRTYPSINITCPICGYDKATKSGFNIHGDQYYKCKQCYHKFTIHGYHKCIPNATRQKAIDMVEKENLSIKEIAKSLNISEKSVRRITKGSTSLYKQTKDDLKQNIKKDILNGNSIKETAQKYNVSNKYVNRIVERTYDTEQITYDQVKMIIRYGIFLRVPVEYIAPYIPCSIHKCSEVLDQFNATCR